MDAVKLVKRMNIADVFAGLPRLHHSVHTRLSDRVLKPGTNYWITNVIEGRWWL